MGLGKYERICKCGCGEVVNIKKDSYYLIPHLQRNFYCVSEHFKNYTRAKLQLSLNAECKRRGESQKEIDDARVAYYTNWLIEKGHVSIYENGTLVSADWRVEIFPGISMKQS